MKHYTHIMITDKGLLALNAPEIETCYPLECKEPNPSKWLESELRYVCSCRLKEVEGLQQAIKEGCYFKDYHNTATILIGSLTDKLKDKAKVVRLEQLKPYDIPDGYEVRVDYNCDRKRHDGYPYCTDSCYYSTHKLVGCEEYAILVPKEKVKCEYCGGDGVYIDADSNRLDCPVCTKGAGDDYPVVKVGHLHYARELFEKQQSIEETAEQFLQNWLNDDKSGFLSRKQFFIAGAKLQAVKELSDFLEWYTERNAVQRKDVIDELKHRIKQYKQNKI